MSRAYRAAAEDDPAVRKFHSQETAHYSLQFANIQGAHAEFRITRSGQDDAAVASGTGDGRSGGRDRR